MRRVAGNDPPVSQHEETTVWKGTSSQLLNFPAFAAAALLIAACLVAASMFSWYIALIAIPIVLIAGWKWLVVKCRVYEITTQRLRLYEGVLNQDIDEIELYRVKDSRILRPFWLRIFGLGNIQLETSDRTHPRPILSAVRDAESVREELRAHVEKLRDEKRVREVDFDETGDSEFGDELG